MRPFIVSVICLWLAAGCQQSVAPRLAIGAVSPDFLLVAVGVLGLFASRRSGTLLGFFGGLLMGAISGANMAGYVFSRTLAGFLIGWFNDLEFDTGAVMALVATAFLTLVSGLLHTFIAPPPAAAFIGTLGATIGAAVVNGVLAMPLYLIVRPVLRSRE
jgi:rod shape-determining protein MreD